MVTIWRGSKRNPYDRTVYDAKHRRKTFMKGLNRLKTIPREAQMKANEFELDLVCVSPKAEPPVCKLLNYGKFRFEQQKKAKEAKKNQHIIEVKEIQLTPQIGAHDMETKARAAIQNVS